MPGRGPDALARALIWLYRQEINVTISSFWDEGYTVKLGDPVNGFKGAWTMCYTPNDIVDALEKLAKEHYPQLAEQCPI